METAEINNIFPDPELVRNILTLRYNPNQTSFLPKKTWQDFVSNNKASSLDFIEKTIEKSIKETIGNTLPDKISIALSGGVDSTLILSILRKLYQDISIEAISIKFANSVDESENASRIAEKFEANHHVVFLENYLKELPKAINIIKLPFWDLHWYYVAKKAQSLSKYIASGDGGDELFGGYTFRYKKFLSLVRSNSTAIDKVKIYLQCHERDSVPDQEKLFDLKSQFSWELIYNILLPYFNNPLSPIEQVFLADYNGKLLYNFSPVNSSINNFFGIRSITPLLSQELISYAIRIPFSYKYAEEKNTGKLILRELLTKYLSSSFVTNEKLGFNVNTLNLWKSYGRKICKYFLLDSRIVSDRWIKKEWINYHIKRDDLDFRYVNKFLGLLAFEIWYRLFVTKEMKPHETLD